MSENNLVYSCNSPVSVTIGSVTYTKIAAFAEDYQAAEGGDAVTPRTVANSHTPEGYTDHPKGITIIVTIDSAEVKKNLEDANFWNHNGSNAALSSFSMVEKRSIDAKTRTVTYNAGNSKIQTLALKYATPDKPLTEIKIFTYGKPAYSNWT
jgi:hypothetical protein